MELFFTSIFLGIVEGLTEFLPISSTGHLILVNKFLNFTGDFANMFDIVIQMGAIIAVVIYFWDRLFPFSNSKSNSEKRAIWVLWTKVFVAVLPALVLGKLFGDAIQAHLFNPLVVSIALFVGGVLLICIESTKRSDKVLQISQVSYLLAFAIGLFQCLAMVPGTSRSAATIIGAMLLGASRLVAVEFSFFLAIPTITAASAYALLSANFEISSTEWLALGTGFLVSFVVAYAVIAFLMAYIQKHNFKVFAYYRILLALLIGVLLFTGVI